MYESSFNVIKYLFENLASNWPTPLIKYCNNLSQTDLANCIFLTVINNMKTKTVINK